MGPVNKLRLSRILLAAAILMIVAFQSYWLNRLYRDEWQSLRKETNSIFRDVIFNVQMQRFATDSLPMRTVVTGRNLFAHTAVNALRIENLKINNSSKDSTHKDSAQKHGTIANVVIAGGGRRTIAGGKLVMSGMRMQDGSQIVAQNLGEGEGVDLSHIAADMIEKIKISPVNLPPTMDSGTLKKLGQSAFNIVVNLKASPEDSALRLGGRPTIVNNVLNDRPRKYFVRSTASATTTSVDQVKKAVGIVARTMPTMRDRNIYRLIANGKVIDDTIPVVKLDSGYRKELTKAGISLNFYLKKGPDDSLHWKDTIVSAPFSTATAGAGMFQPYWYQAGFEDPTTFLLKKISMPILFSLFLVAFTSVTFLFLYRNLVAQRKLTEMKNDFISNITHELKTPLATVSVAVEALRNFGGIQNPERTKEYLDISASELQRLSLLVDKVLKLSLFENRELELKKEIFDLKQLTEEVLNTMKLQFDTHHAKVTLEVQGSYFTINADRLHITSVIFNLLDNALKYSKQKPVIDIILRHQEDMILLQVADKGIGISADFKSKIFDKFFRVPNGDHHNIKGYGLGLSYVSHVVKRHNGTITVDSEPGAGSTFTVKFPIT